MTGKNLLPIALVGAGIYYASTAAANAAQAIGKLSVSGAKIKKINFQGLFSIDVQLEVSINNPGSISIPFEYYTGTITHAGTKISDFTFNGTGKNVQLNARSVTPVIFNLNIGTVSIVSKLVTLVKDIAAGKPVDTVFNISSSFYAGGFDLPVNFKHDIKPGVISGIGKLSFKKLFRKTPVGAGLYFFRNRKKKPTTPAVGSVKATLEFKNNTDMENYFSRGTKIKFYKN